MKCPICKQIRTHKLHTDEYSKKAQLLEKVDRPKAPVQFYPDYIDRTHRKRILKGGTQ